MCQMQLSSGLKLLSLKCTIIRKLLIKMKADLFLILLCLVTLARVVGSRNSSLVQNDSEGEEETSDEVADADFEAPPAMDTTVTFQDDAPFEQEAVTTPEEPVMALAPEAVAALNTDDSTWTAATYDEFEDVDLRTRCGALLDPAEMRQLPLAVHSDAFESDQSQSKSSIPESFDARTKWPKCTTIKQIRNQGSCGSCWAVSSASAMSDRYCIHVNRILRIASTDLINCCGTTCAPTNGDGCQGGYPGSAFDYWNKNGLSTERCSTYVPKFDTCRKKCDSSTPVWAKDLHLGKTSYRVGTSVAQIQTEIMKYGPVVAGFKVFQDFSSYKSGVYQHRTGTETGAHAVRIIGWGTEKGTPYWLVANSWGQTWGESGFFKFLRGSNHLDFETWIVAGTPK